MSRTARLWKGIGSWTLGGLVLSGGLLARADTPSSMADQLTDLGRQAAARNRVAEARDFYRGALRVDPKNAAAKAGLDRLPKAQARRVAFQDPATPPGTPATPLAPLPGTPEPSALERQAGINDVARQAFEVDIRERMQASRDLVNSRNPGGALAKLRDTLTVVQAADNVPEDVRRRLENEVRNQIARTQQLEDRMTLEDVETYKIAATQTARAGAVERLMSDQVRTSTLMVEFDSLMAEGAFRVLDSGGLGDIDTTREPYVQSRFRAQAARAINPYALAPWAGVFVSDTVGFYSQSIQYDRLKEYRAMLSFADVDRSSVPFPDTRAIEYPERSFWQRITEVRIPRYSEADFLFDSDPLTRAIYKKLNDPISMNFQNDTALGEVLRYIQQATQDETAGLPNGIQIYADPVGLNESDVTLETGMIKGIVFEGIPLKITLRKLLAQLKLTYTVKDGVLNITSTESENQDTETRVYYAADLAMIPMSLMGGGMGGGMGGMGGGMGGMGGGMGGMGGGMGGMGGGMGGMGGMMSVAPQDPSQLPGGTSPFEEKKSN